MADVPESAGWLAVASGGLGALIGALGQWLTTKRTAKAPEQAALNETFRELIDALHGELSRRDAEHALFRAETAGEIRQLKQMLQSRERVDARAAQAAPAMVVLPPRVTDSEG